MAKRGKKYREALSKVDRLRNYEPLEAIKLAKEIAFAGFDETVEVHLRMGLDPRKSDQQIRSMVQLPHGTGKEVRVLVFAEGEAERVAREAGADYAGLDDLIEKIQKENWVDWDVSVAIPQVMSKVGRLGKILGVRGLMPNPKAGTIVQQDDLPRVVGELKAGRVEFRMDKTANMHVQIGKVSFSENALLDNLAALMEAVQRAKPPAAKGQYIRKISLTTTMGPGIKLDTFQTSQLRTE